MEAGPLEDKFFDDKTASFMIPERLIVARDHSGRMGDAMYEAINILLQFGSNDFIHLCQNI